MTSVRRALSCAVVLASACSTDPDVSSHSGDNSPVDAADGAIDLGYPDTTTGDASPIDSTIPDTTSGDVATSDTGVVDASSGDALDAADAADASTPPTLLLVAIGIGTSPPSYGASFATGKWSALSPIGTNEYAAVGGGVVVLPDDRGLGVVRGNGSTQLESATWTPSTAKWSTLVGAGSTTTNLVSVPAQSAGHVLVATSIGAGTTPIHLDTFDDVTSTWTLDDDTGATGDNVTIPAVAGTAAGAPVVVLGHGGGASTTYQWTEKTGGAWSTPTAIPGATFAGGPISGHACAAVVTRIGVDQIVLAYLASTTTATSIQSSTFASGAWTSAGTIASDPYSIGDTQSIALAALGDGTVLAAYVASDKSVHTSKFNGTSWSAPVPITGVTVSPTYAPISLARGVGTDVAELAFLDASGHIQHTSLTTTWSSPIPVDATQNYGFVAIGSGP
jgi:hypothetical protein